MTDKEQCIKIYKEAFGDDGEFSKKLFETFFEACRYIKEDERVTAMLFLLPCELVTGNKRTDARYLFAAACTKELHGRGYMTRLLEKSCKNNDAFIFLKPAEPSLVKFYSERGFNEVSAIRSYEGECRIDVTDEFKALAAGASVDGSSYTLMYYGNKKSLNEIAFALPMD